MTPSAQRVVPWASSPRPPRDWQRRALPIIGAALRADPPKRPVVQAVTGSGKSGLQAEIVALTLETLAPDEVIVVSAPRRSLVLQLSGLECSAVRAEWGGGFRPGSIAWRIGAAKTGVYFGDRKKLAQVIVTCNPSLPALAAELALAGKRCRLLIVDEAHRSESPDFHAGVEVLAPRFRLGFSATPWRSASAETLSLFDSVAFSYSIEDAWKDGVLVHYDAVKWHGAPDTHVDVACVEMIRAHARGPGIVSAASVADAEEYAAVLTAAGIPAQAIHSRLSDAEGRERQRWLLDCDPAGPPRCLVHVALLQEGVDMPALRWLCMRRPVGSTIRFVQELGRVLRVCEGKGRALLIDPYNLEKRLGLLHGARVGIAEAIVKAMEREAGLGGDPFDRPNLPPVVVVSLLAAWAQRSLMLLVEQGKTSIPASNGASREALASDSQLAKVRRMAKAAGIPELGSIVDHAEGLTRGEASDLLCLLFAMWTARSRGEELPDLGVPAAAIARLARRAA